MIHCLIHLISRQVDFGVQVILILFISLAGGINCLIQGVCWVFIRNEIVGVFRGFWVSSGGLMKISFGSVFLRCHHDD